MFVIFFLCMFEIKVGNFRSLFSMSFYMIGLVVCDQIDVIVLLIEVFIHHCSYWFVCFLLLEFSACVFVCVFWLFDYESTLLMFMKF
jgi:hypothetical protein